MMRVPNHIAPSRIAGGGTGLFCDDFVPVGSLLWVFDPGLDIEIIELPDDRVVANFLNAYAYMPPDGAARWILCGDNARFFNHSDTPNVAGDAWVTHATADLAAGTELTIDYRTFDRRPIEFWI